MLHEVKYETILLYYYRLNHFMNDLWGFVVIRRGAVSCFVLLMSSRCGWCKTIEKRAGCLHFLVLLRMYYPS